MHATTMAPLKVTNFRLEPEILEALDKHAERMTAQSNARGAKYNRSDALRDLLLFALGSIEAQEAVEPKASKPTPKASKPKTRKP